jgi:hypothetical protein
MATDSFRRQGDDHGNGHGHRLLAAFIAADDEFVEYSLAELIGPAYNPSTRGPASERRDQV